MPPKPTLTTLSCYHHTVPEAYHTGKLETYIYIGHISLLTETHSTTNFPDGTVNSAIPIKKFAGQPPSGYASGGEGFLGTYQGINTIIYAYGGAMLFFNLLAEMRNPWDFWKGYVMLSNYS